MFSEFRKSRITANKLELLAFVIAGPVMNIIGNLIFIGYAKPVHHITMRLLISMVYEFKCM